MKLYEYLLIGINNALNKLRNISIVGQKPFGGLPTISVPQIPKLATGNVAYNETFAIFGEYVGASSNPEITTPQNIMRETFEDVLSRNNNNQPISLNLTVKVSDKKFGQLLIENLRDMKRRSGKDIEALVGG